MRSPPLSPPPPPRAAAFTEPVTGRRDGSTCTGRTCMPEDTLAVAAAVPGARVTIMPGLGHFPMSEDHEAFVRHLLPVPGEIAAAG